MFMHLNMAVSWQFILQTYSPWQLRRAVWNGSENVLVFCKLFAIYSTHTCTHTHVIAHTHTHTHTHACTQTHTHVCTHMYAHTHRHTHTHSHTRTHTHTPPYSLLCVSNNVQVRHARLHHQDVRSFPHITFLGKRTEGLASAGGVVM